MNLAALHRLLVGFTASLIAVSLFSDLLAVLLKKPSLRVTAAWTLAYAAAITPFTALAGYWWWDALIYPDQRRAMPHLWLGLALTAALVPLALWRGRILRRQQLPGALYLLVGAALFAGSTLQCDLGQDAVSAAQQAAAQRAAPLDAHDCSMHSMPAPETTPPPTTAPAPTLEPTPDPLRRVAAPSSRSTLPLSPPEGAQ